MYKCCTACKQTLPLADFAKRKKSKDGLSYECRVCGYKRLKDRGEANSRKVLEYLLDHPCVDCGESDPLVLDFDHVRGVKCANIASKQYIWNWERIYDEIQKCEVRCANCHRRRTFVHFGYLRTRLMAEHIALSLE